ncbi:MAG TPA: glycosyltransferase family 87 protein [Terracidiphilus sp.]|nr:glycosyltransferase family 87 protein [Terracidiphilus sp.]
MRDFAAAGFELGRSSTGAQPMIDDSAIRGAWPSRLGTPPKLRDLNYLVWGFLFVGFVLPFSIVILTSHRPPDADFAMFYSLGRILNEHAPTDLYNYDLQTKLCEEVHPQKGIYGPSPYPPYVGMVFRTVTVLPYWAAYAVWVLISLALYGIGLHWVITRFFPQQALARSLLFALSYSYFPFIAYTAGNGQLSAVGFFAIALALREDDRDHAFRCGLALCLCIYKPTLLILIVPMLLVTRRFKAFLAFVIGTSSLVLLTTAIEGSAIWASFLRAIFSFGNSSVGVKNHSILPLAKYVDLTSFSSNIHGGRSTIGIAIFLCAALLPLVMLIRFWWHSPSYDRRQRALLWAATLTWTLLLNIYVPIYDSILVVLSILMTAGALQGVANKSLRRAFTVTWVLILICSWFSVPLSRSIGIQCMTLLFACLGVVQFAGLHQPQREFDLDKSHA